MATYNAGQLSGTGSIGENLSGLKTFVFANSGSTDNYFTLETVRNPNGFYDTGSATNAAGTWVTSASMGFVSSPYIASVVVPVGVSSLRFTPAASVTGTTYYLRGTGDFTLAIS